MLRNALLVVLLALVGVLAWFESRPEPFNPDLQLSFPAAAPPPQDNRPSHGLDAQVEAEPGRVTVRWQGPEGKATLYRSTTDLGLTKLDDVRFPIVSRTVEGNEFVDEHVPDGVTLYYQVRITDGTKHRYGPVVSARTPTRPLPTVQNPSVLVDKEHYYLEVRDGGRTVKRYPVALGRNPVKRKLHQDNATTPEGQYRIYNLQPQATFYKAFDLDYPNATDVERYELARQRGLLPTPRPGIGGEIQIHGKGIDANWTWGCIALRNEDMDELFRVIGENCAVEIVGRNVTRQDLAGRADVATLQRALQAKGYSPGPADGRLGPKTRRALGLFQLDQGLPLTCEADAGTVERLTPPRS